MNIEGGVSHKGALLPLFFAEHKKVHPFMERDALMVCLRKSS